jgi:hypothetical protein
MRIGPARRAGCRAARETGRAGARPCSPPAPGREAAPASGASSALSVRLERGWRAAFVARAFPALFAALIGTAVLTRVSGAADAQEQLPTSKGLSYMAAFGPKGYPSSPNSTGSSSSLWSS